MKSPARLTQAGLIFWPGLSSLKLYVEVVLDANENNVLRYIVALYVSRSVPGNAFTSVNRELR